MTFRGHIKNGEIVIEGASRFPEGTELRIDVVKKPASAKKKPTRKSVYERLERFVGAAKGLPKDLAEKHDKHAARRIKKR